MQKSALDPSMAAQEDCASLPSAVHEGKRVTKWQKHKGKMHAHMFDSACRRDPHAGVQPHWQLLKGRGFV